MGSKSSPKPQGTPNWADCATLDLAAAEDFYAAVFGWQPERVIASDGAEYSIQRLNGKMVAGIYALGDALREMGVPPHWATYFAVDDVAGATDRVTAAGGTVLDGPFGEPGVGTIAVIQDSVGAYLRVWHAEPNHGGEVFNVPGAMTWNELCTIEPEKAAAFYQEVFGLTPQIAEMPAPYTLLKAEGREVAGILTATPEMGADAHWDVYFATADVHATVALAQDAGGRVIRPPFDIANGRARMAVLQDPQGAVFEIISELTGEAS